MTVNQRIIRALAFSGLPVVANIYTGDADAYFTFNYTILPADFKDNAPEHERYLVQVHYCCPADFNSLGTRKEARRRLFLAGFTYPGEVNATGQGGIRASDGQHYVFECEIAEGTDIWQ